jgi:Peroxidase
MARVRVCIKLWYLVFTGPEIKWRPGRTDYDDKDETKLPPDGRLPDASRDAKHLRDIFYRMVTISAGAKTPGIGKRFGILQLRKHLQPQAANFDLMAVLHIRMPQWSPQGFNDQEIVALSGAHSMGRCHTDRSGFVSAAVLPCIIRPTCLTDPSQQDAGAGWPDQKTSLYIHVS